MHAGGTVESGQKCQSIGLQYIRPESMNVGSGVFKTINLVAVLCVSKMLPDLMPESRPVLETLSQVNLCTTFVACSDGTASGVGGKIEQVMSDRLSISEDDVGDKFVAASMQDYSDLSIAEYLGKEKEGCFMRGVNKIGSWAVDKLTRSKNKK